MSIRERFLFGERLGSGGMAEVFRARRIGVNDFTRDVAIKRMLGGFASSPQFRELFSAEARVTSQLAHPNIVSVLDFDRDDEGALCLVMELVDGCDLARLNSTGLLPFSVVTHVTIEALKGLGHAHAFRRGHIKGVVHRDVSPHNLLVSWHGEVKVSDFGLAKAWSADAATATAGLKGKPAYMSPEQANGEALDGRSDLFSVGVIAWELLTGRRLFGADDTRASLAAVLFGKVPRPSEIRPDVPRDLERVVLKLLQRNRNDRFRRAEDGIADLLACVSARADGQQVLVSILAERFERPVPPGVARREGGTVVARAGTRLAWLSLLTFGLPLVVILIWLAGSRRNREEPTPEVRVLDERIALVEMSTRAIDSGVPNDTASGSTEIHIPHFKYVLDMKEVPRSCRQLFRFGQLIVDSKSTTIDEKRWAARFLEITHDVVAEFVSDGEEDAKIDQVCRGSYGSVELLRRVAPDIEENDLKSLPGIPNPTQGPNPWGDFYGAVQQLHRRRVALTPAELFGSTAQAGLVRLRFPECFAELTLLDKRVTCAAVGWIDRVTYENDIFKWRTKLQAQDASETLRNECKNARDALLKKPAKGC